MRRLMTDKELTNQCTVIAYLLKSRYGVEVAASDMVGLSRNSLKWEEIEEYAEWYARKYDLDRIDTLSIHCL